MDELEENGYESDDSLDENDQPNVATPMREPMDVAERKLRRETPQNNPVLGAVLDTAEKSRTKSKLLDRARMSEQQSSAKKTLEFDGGDRKAHIVSLDDEPDTVASISAGIEKLVVANISGKAMTSRTGMMETRDDTRVIKSAVTGVEPVDVPRAARYTLRTPKKDAANPKKAVRGGKPKK